MSLSAVLAAVAVAGAPTPGVLHADLAGRWKGALGYRDYQTDKLYELPVSAEFRMVPDGAVEVQVSTFDDGPKTGLVYITTTTLFDAKAGTATTASFRKGEKPEIETQAVTVTAFHDMAHWTLTYEATARDDDKPARLRVTETRDGDALNSVEEVAPLEPADAPWKFRNQTRLKKQP